MEKKNDEIVCHVCSHTHWDREWYGSFQEFRMRLVNLVDKVMDIFQNNNKYKYFTLDGQTIVLEDYLEVKPENEEKIKNYIKEGRLIIGPWYVLPDEFLISGESVIKNLLTGKKIGKKFGGWMRIGYLPDTFGHISQMPQILNGFGIDKAIIWRGICNKKEYPIELLWVAPDNSKLLTVRLPRQGYVNLSFVLGVTPEKVQKKLRKKYGNEWNIEVHDLEDRLQILEEVIDTLKDESKGKILLLMNGIDHMMPDEKICDLMDIANEKLQDKGIILKHSTYEKFFDELINKINLEELDTIKGIQRNTVFFKKQGGIILNSILSSRIHNKISNRKIENFLEHYTNPAMCLSNLFFNKSFSALEEVAYKWLLKNHPHDSIGGCSIDEVHRQMETRFEWAYEISHRLFYFVLNNIGENIKEDIDLEENEILFAIFNPLPYEREKVEEVELPIFTNYFENNFILRNIKVKELFSNRSIKANLLDYSEIETIDAFWHQNFAPLFLARKVKFLLKDKLPSLGFKFYKLQLNNKPKLEKENLISNKFGEMENEYLYVKINKNGSLNIQLKEKKDIIFKDLNFFKESGDIGDGYNYSPPLKDEIYRTLNMSPDISLIENNSLRATYRVIYTFKIPEEIDKNRRSRSNIKKEMKINSYISLKQGSRIVEVKTETVNTVKDHIINIGFNVENIKFKNSFSEQQFDIVEFPVNIQHPSEEVWVENQPEQFPLQRFCGVQDNEKGICILSKHLPEYSVEENIIYLTLLRSTGWLSQEDLLTRFGRGGPLIPTLEGELINKKIEVEYAIFPFLGKVEKSQIMKETERYFVKEKAVWLSPWHSREKVNNEELKENVRKGLFSMIKLEGNVGYSTLKESEWNKNIFIFRIWNPFSKSEKVNIKFSKFCKIKNIYLMNLDESVKETLKQNDNIELNVLPKKIVTIGVEIKE